MSTLVGDPLEEPMPLGAATVYLNNFVVILILIVALAI